MNGTKTLSSQLMPDRNRTDEGPASLRPGLSLSLPRTSSQDWLKCEVDNMWRSLLGAKRSSPSGGAGLNYLTSPEPCAYAIFLYGVKSAIFASLSSFTSSSSAWQASFPIHRRYLIYSYCLKWATRRIRILAFACNSFFSDYGLPAKTLLSFIKLLEKRNSQ